VRGTIRSEVIDGKVGCPNCGKNIEINEGKCSCGVKIHPYRRRGRIEKVTWCGPGNNHN